MRTTCSGCRSGPLCRSRARANCRSAGRRLSARPPTCWRPPGCRSSGSVAVTAGASVDIGAEWTASGEFELRLSKPAASTLISRSTGVADVAERSAKAIGGHLRHAEGQGSAGDVDARDQPGSRSRPAGPRGRRAGRRPIEAIQQAIAASIDRSLTLSAQLQVSALRDDQALFAYDIDLARARRRGKTAVGDALHGHLSQIGQAAASESEPIRLVASAATSAEGAQDVLADQPARHPQRRRASSSWYGKAPLTFDPASGALTAADKVSARRIRVKATPLESDSEKLREVMLESLMVTAAYQASRVLGATLTLTAEQIYLEQRGKTRRQDLEDHYRALIALGLCDEDERDERLGTEADFGSTTFVIENHFDAAACDAMFLDGDGTPHAAEHYEHRAAGVPGARSQRPIRAARSAASLSRPTRPGSACATSGADIGRSCPATSGTTRCVWPS